MNATARPSTRAGRPRATPTPEPGVPPVKNRILSMLARSEFRRLRSSLESVVLSTDEVLYAPGDPIRYIYFPDDAVASLLFEVDGLRTVEVAMEGNEGAVGLALFLGGGRSYDLSVVRDSGTAKRLEASWLNGHIGSRGRLPGLLRQYVHALVAQIAQSAVCSRFHTVDARLARWLLMTQDRVGSSRLCATQESISRLLGVRRSSITEAAGGFQKRDLIGYRRGRIEILDRRRLRAVSCSCYEIIKRRYDSFLAR